MSKRGKRKPKRKAITDPELIGLARLLRKRKPTGGFVMLSEYARLKGVAGIR
jgi:hypothetical protein